MIAANLNRYMSFEPDSMEIIPKYIVPDLIPPEFGLPPTCELTSLADSAAFSGPGGETRLPVHPLLLRQPRPYPHPR